MATSRFSFPRRVRIHDEECGAVARALHHAAQKVVASQDELLLISDECSTSRQADPRKVLGSTIERKQMSTKTSIKRIALVAVSALGFGLLAAAPSSATVPTNFEFVTAEAINTDKDGATTVAGAANFVEIRSKADVPGVAARLEVTGGTFINITENNNGEAGMITTVAYNTAATIATTDSGNLFDADGVDGGADDGHLTLRVNTPTAGTVTIKVYSVSAPVNGVTTDTLTDTLTVTVNAAATANVYSAADSTVFGSSNAAALADSTTETALATTPVSVSRTYDGITEVFRVDTTQKDANGNNLTSGFKTITASITGAGTLGTSVNAPVATFLTLTTTTVPAAAAANTFYVFADGRSGVATLTISVNSVVVKTYTMTFYGPLASLKATAKNKVYGADIVAAVVGGAADADTYGVLLQGLDSNGVEVPLTAATVTVTSADTNEFESATLAGTVSNDTGLTRQLLVTVDIDGTNRVGGKPTVMTYAIGTISTTLTLTAGKNASATGTQVVTMATDKSSYLPGEKITITVTGKDSAGNALGDGAQALFTAAPTSNIALSALPVAAPVLSAGVATYTTFAPFVAGTVVITATANSAAATALTTSFEVTGGAIVDAANAASDAALEAIDAANAATDAANLAAEAADAATVAAEEARDAADAATAAVEALASEVATLIASLKAQITTLGNTVAKIAKKVKA